MTRTNKTLAGTMMTGAIVLQGVLGVAQSKPAEPASLEAIRPFKVHFPEKDLIELKRRIRATRWPEKETVDDDSQGVRLEALQSLAQYWATGYDWRIIEAKLNALPMFVTNIDGLDIHFIHVRSKDPHAMPIIITHGWPGSIIELLKIIGPLTDPTAYGGTAADAFDVVIPSMPGYGFSGKPTTTGWDLDHIATAWVVLMKRLGYSRFVAQGGDWGAGVVNVMALQGAPELIAIHTNLPGTIPADIVKDLRDGQPAPPSLSDEERLAYEQLARVQAKHSAYGAFMATRPQTLYGIEDSPIGLAAFLLDHGDGEGQPGSMERALVGGQTNGAVTRDDILDNITLYWLTKTAISSARLYWENKYNIYASMDISLPAGVSAFPNEKYQAPRSWAERAYHKLIYYNRPAKGGHFAAWEQPEIFTEEVRATFRSLRDKQDAAGTSAKSAEGTEAAAKK
jgi:pimeloyl-ACP methyl ester carboxylesterase